MMSGLELPGFRFGRVIGYYGGGSCASIQTPDEVIGRDNPRYGYRMLTDKLRQEGQVANHKRVYRIYRKEGLQLPKRRKRIRSAKRIPWRRPRK